MESKRHDVRTSGNMLGFYVSPDCPMMRSADAVRLKNCGFRLLAVVNLLNLVQRVGF